MADVENPSLRLDKTVDIEAFRLSSADWSRAKGRRSARGSANNGHLASRSSTAVTRGCGDKAIEPVLPAQEKRSSMKLVGAAIRRADLRRHMPSDGVMVKNRRSLQATAELVFDILAASPRPLGAYAVLSGMRGHGTQAAPTIYRALAWLVRVGRIHRIESLKGYVARQGRSREQLFDGLSAVFTICEHCLSVREVDDFELRQRLHLDATMTGFLPRAGTVEILGTCEDCQNAAVEDITLKPDEGVSP